MNPARRIISEYCDLARILSFHDFALLMKETALNAPSILRTRKLTSVDLGMSRDIVINFDGSHLRLPLREMDRMLAAGHDNPSFGNVRELYARNCYLRYLSIKRPMRAVLDLGANRGMFSLLALVHIGADIVVGVEPMSKYDEIFNLLLDVNNCSGGRAPRYRKFIGSPSNECANRENYVCVTTIMSEQSIDRFDLVKIDIEGGENDLFMEPEWLRHVDNITMEIHPQMVVDLSHIPAALEEYGFTYRMMDQGGKTASLEAAMFIVASRFGVLVH